MEILSPDGHIKCNFNLKNGELFYEIKKDDQVIVNESRLSIEVYGIKNYTKNLQITNIRTTNHQETVEMIWGDEQYIDNTYREAIVKTNKINVYLRIFDNAVAFRYELNPINNITRLTVSDELTEFNINNNSISYSIPAYQPDRYEYNYEIHRIDDLNYSAHTPFTIKTASHYVSIHEAALYNYGAMNLKLNQKGKLQSDITPLSDQTKAHIDLPFKTPWRLIMIADTAAELTKNHTMYVLNDPPEGDFSWVKPLKFFGIWWAMYVGEWTWAPGEKHGATTKHAKEYIDEAVKLGIKGLLFEGWNDGWEGDWLENGDKTNFTTSMSDFDLPQVARYAKLNKIELVGHHETVGFIDNYESQLEKAYNYYASNNINYIKTGYSGSRMHIRGRDEYHHSQIGVRHYQKTIELAAKKHICLDIHEPIKSTGIERTWPNLLTREGARGQEYEGGSLTPSHACFLAYTRLLAGGMDYTPGIFDLKNPKKSIHTTIIRQLAYYVTIYSAMAMAADRPKIYHQYPDLFQFIKDVPVSYETSVPLTGEIGEYYVVARKSRDKNEWYIGGITNEEARKIELKLDFLGSFKYRADIYCDGKDAHYLDNPFSYGIKRQIVSSNDQIAIDMAPGGGFAVKLTKMV